MTWTQCRATYVGKRCRLHRRHHPRLHRHWTEAGHVEWVDAP